LRAALWRDPPRLRALTCALRNSVFSKPFGSPAFPDVSPTSAFALCSLRWNIGILAAKSILAWKV